MSESLDIEVAYALPDYQHVAELEVPAGTTARAAARLSQLDAVFPELDLSANPIGVFGAVVDDDHVLHPGDRVELYRPLAIDPRDARRQRVSGVG